MSGKLQAYRHAGGRVVAVASLLVGFLCGVLAPARTQDVINREHTIKAAYLYQFGRYVEWPATAFPSSNSPFLIGVLEPNRVREDLLAIAGTKKIGDRSIRIRVFTAAKDVEPCHVLFLPQAVDPQVQADVIHRLSGHHVLFVGETDSFLQSGGVVNFLIQGNNVRLVVALKAARREISKSARSCSRSQKS